jgi:voltage-gated potassium channel
MAKIQRRKIKARRRKPSVRLQVAHTPRMGRYLRSIASETYFLHIILTLLGLWALFATALYLTERDVPGSSIDSFGAALYWGVAAFSTAGIADTPVSDLARLIGGIWIIVG